MPHELLCAGGVAPHDVSLASLLSHTLPLTPYLAPTQVRSYVLEVIASDPGLQQAELVFLGLFGRACRLLKPEGGSFPAQPCLECALGRTHARVSVSAWSECL